MLYFLAIVLSTWPQLLAQETKLDTERLNNEAGIEMVFRNPSPKFAKLDFNTEGTGVVKGRRVVVYSVSVTGIEQNRPYILMSWDIGTTAPRIALRSVHLGANGRLQCGNVKECSGAAVGTDITLRLAAMIGQPRRFVLTGEDKQPIAMGETIPFPAVGKDGSCSIEAIVLRPNASLVLIVGQGFAPGENLSFASTSRGETVDGTGQADDAGKTLRMVLPFVKGYPDGQTSITLRGSKCQPTTTFHWGSYQEEMAEPAASQ